MPWDEIEGQDRAVHLLRRALSRRQLHHAYLVVGPDGVGKELLARLLAQAANCESTGVEGPCGSCSSCTAIVRGVHPDVINVRPQVELVARGQLNRGDLEGAPSREIRVDEVRQLARRLSFALVRGRRKIALVSPADALNERAQNALLKTLEEPPADTTFLLVTAHPDLLLPTVRSRCQRLTLVPLSEAAIAGRLLAQGIPEAAARARAARAEGSLGRALSLTAEEIARHDELLHRLESTLHAGDEREALDVAEELGERDPAQQAAEVLLERTRQLLILQAKGEPAPLSPEGLLRQHDLCAEAVRALEQNGNARLQLERLLLGLRDLRALAPALTAHAAGGAHV